MKTRMLVMRPEQPHETVELDGWPREPGYDRLRAAIEPILNGSLEHVSVFADFSGGNNYKPLDMFVDDMGLLKRLPRNEAATLIYRRANQMGLTGAPKAPDPEMLSFIAGTAILFDRRVWF